MTWLMYKSEQWVANCEDGSGLTITAPDIKTIMGAIKQIAGDEKFYIKIHATLFEEVLDPLQMNRPQPTLFKSSLSNGETP